MRNTDDKELLARVLAKKEPSVNRAKTLENNISNGRKIFRLLLWLNEINEILNLIDDKKMNRVLRFMKIVSTICSFFYYLTDNAVWLAGMGYMNHTVYGRKWKDLKNSFSLWKTVLEIIIAIVNIVLKH